MKISPVTNFNNTFNANINLKNIKPNTVSNPITKGNKDAMPVGSFATLVLILFTLFTTLGAAIKCTRDKQEKAIIEHVIQNDTLRVNK